MKQEWPKENVWGCMGVGISRRQLEELGRTNKDLVLFLDNDRAGEELKKVIYHRLKGSRRIYEMKDYHGCNDPEKLTKKGCLPKLA